MSRWQILKRIAHRKGWWYLPFMFTVGPLVLVVRGIAHCLIWLGNRLLDITGAPPAVRIIGVRPNA